MKFRTLIRGLLLLILLACPLVAQESPEAEEPEPAPPPEPPKTVELFNGTDLTGWTQQPEFSVREGQLFGQSVAARMIFHSEEWKGDYAIKAEIKFGPPQGNFPYSGIMIGAHNNKDNVVIGQMKDQLFAQAYKGQEQWIHTVPIRRFRGDFKENDFNTWEIQIRGDRMSIYVNDFLLFHQEASPDRFTGTVGVFVQKFTVTVKSLSWNLEFEDYPARKVKGWKKHDDGWGEMESKYYRVLTQCDQDKAEKLLDRMDVIFKQYMKYYDVKKVPAEKSTIVLFKDMDAWRKDGFPVQITGAYTDHTRELASYWPGDRDDAMDQFYATYFHEGNHQFFHMLFPNNVKSVPIWFNEGFSECFAAYAFKGKKILFNQANTFVGDYHIKFLRPALASGRFVPWRQLFAMSQQQFYRNMDFNYSEAWAICAFLLAYPEYEGADGKYSAVIDQLLEAYKSGKAGQAAYDAAFQLDGKPLDLNTLEAEWKEWLKGMPGM